MGMICNSYTAKTIYITLNKVDTQEVHLLRPDVTVQLQLYSSKLT
jgi:hypothetical protein